MSELESEGQRPANKPAQGNALGFGFRSGGALKGRHTNQSTPLFRPFRADALFYARTQGVALGWLGTHLWCSTAIARLEICEGGTLCAR